MEGHNFHDSVAYSTSRYDILWKRLQSFKANFVRPVLVNIDELRGANWDHASALVVHNQPGSRRSVVPQQRPQGFRPRIKYFCFHAETIEDVNLEKSVLLYRM